ncbi:MAG: hypothetical protein P1U40_07950 [Coxiellaceae bacterium]|nr:hypothetical protein [Coxiellaceae bacterium]
MSISFNICDLKNGESWNSCTLFFGAIRAVEDAYNSKAAHYFCILCAGVVMGYCVNRAIDFGVSHSNVHLNINQHRLNQNVRALALQSDDNVLGGMGSACCLQ